MNDSPSPAVPAKPRPVILVQTDPRYPSLLRARLGTAAPVQLTGLGTLALLALPKTALFSSSRCPGTAILAAYDQAAHWRAQERCVISGFHSPMEKECLRILLRGQSPVIVCPARGLPRRLPAEWQRPMREERLLVLTIFGEHLRRATSDLALARNLVVAALAQEHYFAHIAPGSHTEALAVRIAGWSMPQG